MLCAPLDQIPGKITLHPCQVSVFLFGYSHDFKELDSCIDNPCETQSVHAHTKRRELCQDLYIFYTSNQTQTSKRANLLIFPHKCDIFEQTSISIVLCRIISMYKFG